MQKVEAERLAGGLAASMRRQYRIAKPTKALLLN